MAEYPNKQELEAQEKIINVIETIQAVSRKLWALLVLTLVLFLPLHWLLRAGFTQFLTSIYQPPAIVYVAPIPVPLEISQTEFFLASENQAFAYSRLRNPNPDLALRVLPYEFKLLNGAGETLARDAGETYILPNQEKVIFMPLSTFSGQVLRVEFTANPENWSRLPNFFPLTFGFENQNFGITPENQNFVEAILLNDSPYFISQLELGVLLYNLGGQVVGANYTTVNALEPRERRYFRVIGTNNAATGVVRVEFLPSVNQLDRSVLSTDGAPLDDRNLLR